MNEHACERPVVFGPDGSMIGIVTTPREADGSLPAVLLPNAGLLHRVGPHRINVQIARRLARFGFTSLRFDLRGFGDSRPRSDRLGFREGTLEDARAAMAFLTAFAGVERFVLIGLCSGADLSLELAASEDRVEAALLIDSFAFSTVLYRLSRYRRWLRHPGGRRRLVESVGNVLRHFRRLWPSSAEEDDHGAPSMEWRMPPRREVLGQVEAALEAGARLGFVYSGGESFYNYLTHFFFPFQRLRAAGRIDLHRFPEADHTFTIGREREKLLRMVETWVAQSSRLVAPEAEVRRPRARTDAALGGRVRRDEQVRTT